MCLNTFTPVNIFVLMKTYRKNILKLFNKKTMTSQRAKNNLKNIYRVGLLLFFTWYFFERLDSVNQWGRKFLTFDFPGMLFFFSSDFFEYGTTALLAVISYYLIKKTALEKFFWGCLAFCTLYGIGLLKSIRSYASIELKEYHTYLVDVVSTYDFLCAHYVDILLKAVLYLFNYLGAGVTFFAVFILIDRIDLLFNNRYQKIQEKFKKAQTQLLQRQLNPHFLYNAFNSLYSLSLQKHPQTPEAILTLSNIMRYITDHSGHRVSLDKELAFIAQYIAIEKMRFASEDRIKITTKGNTDNHFIEPLLLITLIENAFKHGFYSNDPAAFINIEMVCEKENIRFEVQNTAKKEQNTAEKLRKGKGLEMLKKRLELTYPKKHRLTLTKKDGIFTAVLQLKC